MGPVAGARRRGRGWQTQTMAASAPGGQPLVAVVDIDGVVADVRHRLHLVESRPKRWPEFFAAADDDPALEVGVSLVHQLAADHDVVWLTGRPERTRAATVRWLAAHDLPAGTLLMRGDRDFRPARVTKRDELRRLRRTREVAVVVDDDPEVVALLQADGFPVRLADWLPHSSTLRAAQEREGRT
jgi:hypothetical protein